MECKEEKLEVEDEVETRIWKSIAKRCEKTLDEIAVQIRGKLETITKNERRMTD